MRKRVLLVDDDPDTQQLISVFLDLAGFSVKVASGGHQAISELRDRRFELIILDIFMPVMSGFEVLKSIREDERLKKTPIIMLSGSTNKDDILRGQSFNISDYIIKPVKRSDLLQRIKRTLGDLPQYEEFFLNEKDTLAKGVFQVPVQLLSISNRGATIRSSVSVDKKFLIDFLKLSIFEDLNIKHNKFFVADCVPAFDKGIKTGYEYFLQFANLNQFDQKKIRQWIINKTFDSNRNSGST